MSNIFKYNKLSYPVRHITIVTYVSSLPEKEGYIYSWIYEFFIGNREVPLVFETKEEAEKSREQLLNLIGETNE